jgi:hypothetical protein
MPQPATMSWRSRIDAPAWGGGVNSSCLSGRIPRLSGIHYAAIPLKLAPNLIQLQTIATPKTRFVL